MLRPREKEVRLTVFDNEPMARLAEQRLRQDGIPCFIRSLGAGLALWGTTYSSSHALYVYQADEARAREVLDLAPREVLEREKRVSGRRPRLTLVLVLMILLIVHLIFGITVLLVSRFGG